MTDTVKHTPGPWSVDGPLGNQIVWSGPYNRVCFLAHSDGRKPDQDKANGLLIAAAPELLEALKELADYHSADLTSDFGNEAGRMRNALAAIAKAEGRS